MTTKKNKKNGVEQTTEQKAAPAVETAPQPQKTNGAEKVKKPSISAATRELVILNQDKTVDEISQMLIAAGWDASDVTSRKSTITTLRTDTLAVINIAKEKGCWK